MNTIKLNNIEKVAQGRVSSGFSPRPFEDIKVASKWLIELVQEVRRLDAQRRVHRLRIRAIHKLLAKVEKEWEKNEPDEVWDVGFDEGRYKLAQEIKKLLGTEDD